MNSTFNVTSCIKLIRYSCLSNLFFLRGIVTFNHFYDDHEQTEHVCQKTVNISSSFLKFIETGEESPPVTHYSLQSDR